MPWLTHCHPRLFRYKDETVSENKPILGGKLLALCDYMHIRALFGDRSQMDKVTDFYLVTLLCF